MITKELTFQELEELEPGLAILYRKAKRYRTYQGYCPVTTWYDNFKPQLTKLVGWFARQDGEIITGRTAYDLAYKTIEDALPRCPKGCQRCS